MEDSYTELMAIYEYFRFGGKKHSEKDEKLKELFEGEMCPNCKRFHMPVSSYTKTCKLCLMHERNNGKK